MNFRQMLQQAIAEGRKPENIARLRQNLDALGGLVEVAREGINNALDDVEKTIDRLSTQAAQAQSEVTEDVAAKEKPNWDKIWEQMGKPSPFKEDAPDAPSEPVDLGEAASWSAAQKFDWLIDNHADDIWTKQEADAMRAKSGYVYDMTKNFLCDITPTLVDGVFARYYKP